MGNRPYVEDAHRAQPDEGDGSWLYRNWKWVALTVGVGVGATAAVGGLVYLLHRRIKNLENSHAVLHAHLELMGFSNVINDSALKAQSQKAVESLKQEFFGITDGLRQSIEKISGETSRLEQSQGAMEQRIQTNATAAIAAATKSLQQGISKNARRIDDIQLGNIIHDMAQQTK